MSECVLSYTSATEHQDKDITRIDRFRYCILKLSLAVRLRGH